MSGFRPASICGRRISWTCWPRAGWIQSTRLRQNALGRQPRVARPERSEGRDAGGPMMRNLPRKRRTREHIIADLSVNHVERQALLCGHVVERRVFDYGIDLEMFTFTK